MHLEIIKITYNRAAMHFMDDRFVNQREEVILTLKYIREFHTLVCYCGGISTPRNVMLNETNCDWLLDMSLKRPHGRALANKSCHGFQTFSRQSGYARLSEY